MRQLIPLILFLIAVFGTFFYTKPLYSDIQKELADKDEYEIALEKADELEDKITELNNVKNGFSGQDLDRLSKMIPENIDTVRLIIEINEIAKRYSTGIKSVAITDAAAVEASEKKNSKQTAADTIALGFTLSATYPQFLSFLEELERNLRLADIATLSFASSDTQSVYPFNVTIKTYRVK